MRARVAAARAAVARVEAARAKEEAVVAEVTVRAVAVASGLSQRHVAAPVSLRWEDLCQP